MVGSPYICNLRAAIQCLQHQIRGSGLRFSNILVAAPLGVGSGLHCGGLGSAGGRATPEPFPALESAPYLQSQDPARLLCALRLVHTRLGGFDFWIRALLHRQHADCSSAVHPQQAFAASPKNELPKRGLSIPRLPFCFGCWLEQLSFLAAGHSWLLPEPCFTLTLTKSLTKLTTTTTANQQHLKIHAKQTTNYSTKALLVAYLQKYG